MASGSFCRRTMLRFLLSFFLLGSVSSGLVKYDQTQTGDYNIHLDLKNIEVLAFLDDSSVNIGEYDYDYGELTLKPPAAPNNDSTSTWKPETSSSTGFLTDSGDTNNSTSTTTIAGPTETTTSTHKPHRRCGAGFYRDTSGRCRRLRRPIKLGGLIQQAKDKLSG